MTFWSLLAKSLVIILIEVFNNEMGLKSTTVTGPLTLGVRVTK
jgi:hypothetical protein